MKVNQFTLTKVIKFFPSSTSISIVISICLLVNLFVPRFTTFLISVKGEYPCEHHICGCKTAPDCLSHCCCEKILNTLDMKCSLKENPKDIPSAFIQSLACAGVPDKFTAVSNTISLPEDVIFIPDIHLFYFLQRLEPASPISFPISPPDKPPKIT